MIPLDEMAVVDDTIFESVAAPQFHMWIIGLFAALALMLVAVGVYGITAYTVGQRTREFGIRRALGANDRSLLWMVLGQGVRMAAVGVPLGILGAYGLTRLLVSFLFDASVTSPIVYGGVSFFVLAVIIIASYVPARQACAVNPVDTLRSE